MSSRRSSTRIVLERHMGRAPCSPLCNEGEPARQERIRRIFDSLDLNGNGKLEVREVQQALNELGLPSGKNYVAELLQNYDRTGDGEITYDEFVRYVATKEAAIKRAFQRMDADGSGHLDKVEVLEAVTALGLGVTSKDVEGMVGLLDTNGDGVIGYEEFKRFVLLLPGAQVSNDNILAAWVDSASWVESMEYRLNHIPPKQPLQRLLAGGVAGAVSRTVVAPLERLRTIMMTSPNATRLVPVLRGMWAEGGLRGMFRGNLATVAKVVPSSAIQFAVYDSVKDMMTMMSQDKSIDLTTAQKFSAGLIAGAAACTVTYPLEALRTQIQVASSAASSSHSGTGSNSRAISKSSGNSYLAIAHGAFRERGLAGIYQGYSAGLLKDSATQGLGFASYEALLALYRQYITGGANPSTSERGFIGGGAAFITMTLTMPLENVMRRMQVQGRPGYPRRYRNPADCAHQMLRKEGLAAFWRGSLGSYMKVVPSIAATRMLYDSLVTVWGIGGVRKYRLASEQQGN